MTSVFGQPFRIGAAYFLGKGWKASRREKRVVQVIVDVHVPDVDRVFHYIEPAELARPLTVGDRVLVPFGHRPKVEGYVVGFVDGDEEVSEGLKPVLEQLDEAPLLSLDAVEVAHWMQERYLCPLVQALQCFLPPGTRLRAGQSARPRVVKGYQVVDSSLALQNVADLRRSAPKQAELLQLMLDRGKPLTFAEMANTLKISRGPLLGLLEKGLIVSIDVHVERNLAGMNVAKRSPLPLNPEQAKALAAVIESLDKREPSRVLLQGVTGSGKTEVYLQAIAHARKQGKGAMLLVPEIALTTQTIRSLQQFFGSELAVLHSGLSIGERYDQWFKIWRGEVNIVVGARSAVFAPVNNLGLIVIDEEHESSYKQADAPRYHAREVAWARAQTTGATLLLGSATPSLEMRYASQRGKINALVLSNRIDRRPLPQVQVVDMREELAQGNRSMFSRVLMQYLERALERQEQALLFINRRGFASFLLCRQCGYVPRCHMCEVSLTFHQPDRLCCHYCDAMRQLPAACPQCAGPYLRPFGGGTQRVQQELARLFPSARHVRMDVDTTGRKGAHARILSAFEAHEYDVLIGTQMIAKGLHFPSVTVVGVISADIGLHFPEFRAAERTFQLLTQVAGRAGRGDRPGDVIVQTYDPNHHVIRAAALHDYEGFAEGELAYRRRIGYPPYTCIVRCIWSGEDEDDVIKGAERGFLSLQNLAEGDRPDTIGPSPAPLSRIKGMYRWHLLLKGSRRQVIAAAHHIRQGERRSGSLRFVIDVDPLSLL